MSSVNFPIQLAPENLEQSFLNGWRFSLFSINLGDSSDPDIEKAVIQQVGSYGKQIGHLSEALEVALEQIAALDAKLREADRLIAELKGEKRLAASAPPPPQPDAVKVFLGDVAGARSAKRDARARKAAAPAAAGAGAGA